MLFFGIVFVLYFFRLSGKSGFWKKATRHFVRGTVGLPDVDIIIEGRVISC